MPAHSPGYYAVQRQRCLVGDQGHVPWYTREATGVPGSEAQSSQQVGLLWRSEAHHQAQAQAGNDARIAPDLLPCSQAEAMQWKCPPLLSQPVRVLRLLSHALGSRAFRATCEWLQPFPGGMTGRRAKRVRQTFAAFLDQKHQALE